MFDDDYDLTTAEGLTERTAEILRRRIPLRYRDATATDPGVLAWCDQFAADAADGTPPRSLLITGPTGTGKTWQAYGAVRAVVTAGLVSRWEAMTAPDLYARLRPAPGADTEAAYQRVASTPLLMLDDLGAAKDSEWTEEVTYRLVNQRSACLLPSIFTTNLPLEALRGAVSERVFSRLAECALVAVKGTDRRLGRS